ncbi:MAG TPA: tubulin-like doman-containing protein [Candidatus Limnocylindrales bacterium]|nr:tubulin-like doman-containing protein [Candidatus Limnocylindrales bacterium]
MIGLGSAGTNIVETFLTNKKTKELMENDITRLSLLAIDIADPEIRSLQETYEQIERSMVKAGIPSERMRLIAQSVKFPTAEAMFDFINQKYAEYLIGEGAKLNFHPWLESTMAIPPMAGGAGRRRALAKAIYALNYYQLGIIKNCINSFKEQALSGIITPTIILVYGLGGGTGSGVFFDFARHLRKVLGSGVPIIAFVITPCGGDDPPAKGCSAFVSINELTLLLNRDYNEYVTEEYGECYRNPLNALIYLPLLPAYSKIGNIVSARREMDDMFVDMLYVLMDFDLADLLGGIGTEVGLTYNAAHTLGMVKVVYPVEEYISAYKLDYEEIQILQDLRREKLDILDEIGSIINVDFDVARELYKNYLIKTGTYNEEQFEEKLKTTIESNPRLEDDLALHVKGVEIQVKNWLNEIMKFLSTIKQMGKTGPIEDSIINLTLRKEGSRKVDNLEGLLTTLTKNYMDFREKKAIIVERLNQLIPSSQVFTVRQKKILEDLVNLAEIAEKCLDLLQFYDQTRYLTDALIRYYEVLPDCQSELNELKDIQAELGTIYLIIQLMLRTPYDESKMIDENLTYINEILSKRIQSRGNLDNEVMRIQESKKRKEFDKERLERQMRKVFGGKRYAREQLLELDRDLKRIETEESLALDNLNKADNIINQYEALAKRFELTSPYRKKLNKIVDVDNEYNQMINEIAAPKKYFEKSADLTENEQLKIIFKILTEQEETLTREIIAKDILDIDHYKDYIRSIIRAFKTPTIMGYKPTYKTDYIWVTIVSPPNMWTEDLSQEVYTSLAGYVTSEVSRTITVRVIESRDPWTTRVLVVAGRGKPEDMEAYDEMQLLYNKSNDFERHLSRSYLLEEGVSALQVIKKFSNDVGAEENNNQKK